MDDILAKQAYIQQNMSKKDPFDQGIMRAIKSSKESLAMDEEQEDRALRNSMISFGDAIGQMPRAKGFLANLAQAGRALSPALKTHTNQLICYSNGITQIFDCTVDYTAFIETPIT